MKDKLHTHRQNCADQQAPSPQPAPAAKAHAVSDGELAGIFFVISLLLTLVAMVLSPLEIDQWSIAAAAVALVTGLGGIYLAFSAWKEPLPEDLPEAPEGTAPEENN